MGAPSRLPWAARNRQQGYVLILVLAGLALIAVVVGQLASRVDSLRVQAAAFQSQQEGEVLASKAFAAALHWIATHPGGPASFGNAKDRLVVDGRPYRLDNGSIVAVQDLRGLVSLNLVDDDVLGRLLLAWGATPQQRDTLLDVLKDYADTDSLRRLNGAEAPDYAERGLPAPANDWLVSVRELSRMLVWRESPDLAARLQRYASVRRSLELNPNVTPMPLLRAALPLATPEQLTLFDTLRQTGGFLDGRSASRATGLQFPEDRFVFHTSNDLLIVVWAPGMTRARAYDVVMMPGSGLPPWLITDVRLVDPPLDPNGDARPDPFPVPSLENVKR